MKITRSHLAKIIKEEYDAVISEAQSAITVELTQIEANEILKALEDRMAGTPEYDSSEDTPVSTVYDKILKAGGPSFVSHGPQGGPGFSGGQMPVDEADEGGEGVHDIFNLPEPEAVEPSGNPKEDALRQIVAQHQAAKVDGRKVDAYSASAVVQVLDAISQEQKENFLTKPVGEMIQIAFKLLDTAHI
jgi:hypothetical protein